MSILVVEEEEAAREITTSTLVSNNYLCREARNVREALAVLGSDQEIGLILADFTVSKLDGIGLLDITKERYPDIPVVVITSVDEIPLAYDAIGDGAYDCRLRPFNVKKLLATVHRALENRQLKMEIRTYKTNLESLVQARTEQLNNTMRNLERSYDITLEALGDALDLKEAETEGHSKRVTAFTIAMAKHMGLNDKEIRVIARGAFLHDIGKMAIPDAILRKPGALTPDEVTVMREHCLRGYRMLEKIPFVADAAQIVYSHHERYDGTGYPRGLKGDQILLGAKLVALANTLDAITSDRPYRAAQSLSAACEEIKCWSGRQFDPQIVRVFLSMPENVWRDLRNQINSQSYRFAYSATDKRYNQPPTC